MIPLGFFILVIGLKGREGECYHREVRHRLGQETLYKNAIPREN